MSSDESSGSDNRQRTVAELLAANGKEQSSATPRRRRRRAEDATEETAPQAIIDRVRSDSGTFRPIDPNEPPPAPTSHSGAHRSGHHQPVTPVAPRHSPPPQQPAPRQDPPAARQAPPWPAPGGQQSQAAPTPPTVRREPPRQAPQQPPPPTPRPGALGARLSGKEADPHTEEFAAVAQEWPEAPRGGEPPAGLGAAAGHAREDSEEAARSGAAQRASVANRLAGLRRPQKDGDSADGFDAFGAGTGTGIAPAAPQQPGVNGTGHGAPVGYVTEPHPDEHFEDEDYVDGDYRDEEYPDGGYGDEEYHYAEEPGDGYQDGEFQDEDYQDEDYQDEDGEDGDYDEDTYEDEDVDEGAGSPREWLTLAGLVAASVVGGAAVWLAFDWFWGVLPAGALAGALVVIAAMVWIVRKFRHAEDMQTMVLSVVAGLVMTVSPAALLLLGR